MLLSLPLFRKSSSKTINIVSFKKPQAKSMAIFMPKRSKCCPRTGFCTGTMLQSMQLPQPRTSNGGEGIKTIRYPLYSPADIFFILCGVNSLMIPTSA